MAIATQPTHHPVLLKEAIDALLVRMGSSYLDCTVGGGGHAEATLERCTPGGRLLGIELDVETLAATAQRLSRYGEAVTLVRGNFRHLAKICDEHGVANVDGILFDLGLSSMHLGAEGRGFSFQYDAPLDMRFDASQELTAAGMVNNLSEEELANILYSYGEEPRGRQIARAIVRARPLKSTLELAKLVAAAYGGYRGKLHPATRTFQAIRIAVNKELESLEDGLRQAVSRLAPGGRLVVISFHSLEDRVAKGVLREESRGCLCSPRIPVCICGHVPSLRLVTRSPIRPSPEEVSINPRSRSAKMRVAEALGHNGDDS
ncbi:MAG: Ribosomal small subunit methyltransferase [Dehalococcoidia bacterium]|nr:Ribosomal small subunit methyltransferase [Dehalococcoidia bacterium]